MCGWVTPRIIYTALGCFFRILGRAEMTFSMPLFGESRPKLSTSMIWFNISFFEFKSDLGRISIPCLCIIDGNCNACRFGIYIGYCLAQISREGGNSASAGQIIADESNPAQRRFWEMIHTGILWVWKFYDAEKICRGRCPQNISVRLMSERKTERIWRWLE